MTATRGITLLDLLPNAPGAALVHISMAEQLGALAVLEYRTTITDLTYTYHGTIQSVQDMGLPALRNWPVKAPGLNAGVPFQLIITRTGPPAPQQAADFPIDGPSANFQLDLFLNQVSIEIPGLRPAKLIESQGTTAAHLERDDTKNIVRIIGGGVLRISSQNGQNPAVRFVDQPDPFDVTAPSGAVFTLGFDPPHFFIGGATIGVTVDRLTYDDSALYTPPDIAARGHDEAWRGIQIKEATLYLPPNAPIVGDVSVGVRDVLLGSPFGLQGELRLEFGVAPADPSQLAFFIDGQQNPLTVSGQAPNYQVEVPVNPSGHYRLYARFNQATGHWILPNGQDVTAVGTGYFDTTAGSLVKVQAIAAVQGAQPGDAPTYSPMVTFQVVESGTFYAPQIAVTDGPNTWDNVLFVSGSAPELHALVYQSVNPPSPHVTWQLGVGPGAQTGRGATFAPNLPPDAGSYLLSMTDDTGRRRHLTVELLPAGNLLVGTEVGVQNRAGMVAVRSVETTYDLTNYHVLGALTPSGAAASVPQAQQPQAEVPDGTLARVAVEMGQPDSPSLPATPKAPPEPVRRVQILMEFDKTDTRTWGDYAPPGAAPGNAYEQKHLDDWVASWDQAQTTFLVIGRTDDLGPGNLQSRKQYNTVLGTKRASAGAQLLTMGNPNAKVVQRSEQLAKSDSNEPVVPPNLASDVKTQSAWLIQDETGLSGDTAIPRDTPPRPKYRRVDLYAVGKALQTAPTQPQQAQNQHASLRRVLVPGKDFRPQMPVPHENGPSYRVRLVVKWDSPTVVEPADAIPTMAELTVAWEAKPVQIPGSPGQETVMANPASIYTVVTRFSYDSRTSETVVMLQVSNQGDPDGITSTDSKLVATALGLGPAIMAGLDAAGVDGSGAKLGALVGASVILANWAKDTKTTFHSFKLEHHQRSIDTLKGVREKFTMDYSVQIGFSADTPILSLNSVKPMRVRYKGVGAQLEPGKSGLDALSLLYDDASYEIEDPGQWTVGGALGDLLRVVATRIGSGSTWVEMDLAFALDLGVVRIDTATVRVTFAGPEVAVELRGLGVSVNVPGALTGGGRVTIGANSSMTAALELSIIPAQLSVKGGLVLDSSGFVNIYLATTFAVGLPLANSGLGLFGFVGQFVANGQRKLTKMDDPIAQEINWFRTAPLQKFESHHGQWAIGLGALVGTLPDQGFTFNALGMLVVAFPEPTVVFGLDATLISPPPDGPSDKGKPAQSFEMLGLVVVDPTAVKLGIRANYEIPYLLRLDLPISAYFPLDRKNPSYFRVGSDGVKPAGFTPRPGDPISIVLLPGLLDVKAWAYLMIEERDLHLLGNQPLLVFDGFSIGFGAGWGIDWSAGPFSLTASAALWVGLGTNPFTLAGVAIVDGELDLGLISLGIHGELQAIIGKSKATVYWRVYAHLCAEVDLLLFTAKGCVGIELGADPSQDVPAPDSPLSGIALTERFGRVTGKAVRDGIGDTVWVDTVPVLQFRQFMVPDIGNSAFVPVPQHGIPAKSNWGGTNDLKYAFRLTDVQLRPKGGAAISGPLDASWWLPTHRNGVAPPPTANPDEQAEHIPPGDPEGRSLALLSWHPAPWAANLDDGGAGTSADPATTIQRICERTPPAIRSCVLGRTAERNGPSKLRMTQEQAGQGPFPSNFALFSAESYMGYDMAALANVAASKSLTIVQGAVRTLPTPYQEPKQPAIDSAYEFGLLKYQATPLATVQFEGQYAGDLQTADLVLALQPHVMKGISRESCHTYRELPVGPQKGGTLSIDGCTYTNLHTRTPLSVGNWIGFATNQLMFGGRGVRITLRQPAMQVRVKVSQLGATPVQVRVYDSTDLLLGTANGGTTPKAVTSVTINATNIAYVVVDGGGGQGLLVEVCYTLLFLPSNFPPEAVDLVNAVDRTRAVPQVVGVHPDGTEVEWSPTLLNGADPAMTRFVRYASSVPGPWTRVRVSPYAAGRVALVKTCGVTVQADNQQQNDEQVKQDLTEGIKSHADSNNAPDGRFLLTPDQDYEIVVSYQYVSWWKKVDLFGPFEDISWSNAESVTEIWGFHTAPVAQITGDAPDFHQESHFDPRQLSRYILGWEPDGKGAPHFLDDPLLLHFAVDYPKQLLNLYGRDLKLELKRTNPPAGTKPDPLVCQITWAELSPQYRPSSDQRLLTAIEAAPCLPGTTHLGGTTATITAPLEPRAEYDLILTAPSLTHPKDTVLLGRVHFRTSRYHNPAEMADRLGFESPDPNPAIPHDFLITGAQSVPATAALPVPADDDGLQSILKQIGMDPWPLPDGGRAVTLWKKGNGWQLVGLLVEIDEPLERANRLHLIEASVNNQVLKPVQLNAAGSRIMLAPATPITVAGGDKLTLVLQDGQNQLTGQRWLAGGPRTLYQEGLL